MKESKFSKTYFGHLNFYYIPHSFAIPISAIIDGVGIVICFGFWGLSWSWKREI